MARSVAGTARKTEGLKLLRAGVPVAKVCSRLGVSRRQVQRWEASIASEIAEAEKAIRGGIVEGATEAKRILASSTVEAAKKAVRIMRSPGENDVAVKASRVSLAACALVLDRGGVPAKAELDLDGTLLESIHATLDRARKGVK